MDIDELTIFGRYNLKDDKVTSVLLQVINYGGASLLRSVFGMLGADVVSNEIVHVEFYAEKASESIPTHAKITLNDFNIFIVSKWEGMTSASLQKYSKDILVNKRDKLLYITSESQCQIVDMSDQVLCTNWADLQFQLNKYSTENQILKYLINQFGKLLDSLYLQQKQEEDKKKTLRNTNHLYYLTDIDKDLLGNSEEGDWLKPRTKEHIIWKYMSLEHALEMIETQKLYLVNPKVWKDPYESFFVEASYKGEPDSKSYAELFTPPKQLYCTCFTDAYQNDAQWNLYSGDDMAVMIGFDVEKLLNAFSECRTKLFIGRVNYVEGGWAKCRELTALDKESIKKGNIKVLLSLMLRKRINYSYEREIRLMCLEKDSDKEKEGILVSIPKIMDSIVRIRVSPKVGSQTIKMLKKYLNEKGLKGSRSLLLAKNSRKNEIDL